MIHREGLALLEAAAAERERHGCLRHHQKDRRREWTSRVMSRNSVTSLCGRRSRRMHELELEPVGIDEEQRVIPFAILWVVGWRVENGSADRDEQLVQLINVVAGVGNPGQVMQ